MTSHSNITPFILTPNRHSTIFYINLPIGFNCSFSEGTKMPFEPILTSVYNCASKMLKKSYRWEDSLDLRIILEMLRFMQLYMHLAVKVFILIYLSPISILLYVIHLLSAFVSDMYHHSESKRKLFKKNQLVEGSGFFSIPASKIWGIPILVPQRNSFLSFSLRLGVNQHLLYACFVY